LIPFAGLSRSHLSETVYNCIVFIPFGLLLSISFKQVNYWRRLIFIFIFSAVVEVTQFIFAIGVTDITDIITNTLGGLLGLILYDISGKYFDEKKRDQFVIIVGTILLALLIVFRLLVRVRYHSAH
jgi:glycopeptide antibiotics resistance protein